MNVKDFPLPDAMETRRLAAVALREAGDAPPTTDWQAAALKVCRAVIDEQVSKRTPAEIADRGPWVVNTWSGDRVVLQSDDFTHDVALVVTGDFGDLADKIDYAKRLATQFNRDSSMGALPRHRQAILVLPVAVPDDISSPIVEKLGDALRRWGVEVDHIKVTTPAPSEGPVNG